MPPCPGRRRTWVGSIAAGQLDANRRGYNRHMQGGLEDRSLTALDRLLAGIDGLVRGIAAPPPNAARPYPADHVTHAPLTAQERRRAAGLERGDPRGQA